jgi:hypothetical protein
MDAARELTHRDQIHGDVYYDPLAVELLATEPLQRLGRVYQLGYGHLVYRGGTHTRLSHSLGAYATAGRLVSALEHNYETKASRPRGAIEPEEFLPERPSAPDLSLPVDQGRETGDRRLGRPVDSATAPRVLGGAAPRHRPCPAGTHHRRRV